MIEVPAVVRSKARAAGAEDWLERLPLLVSGLEVDWSIEVGHAYEGGTEAFVADATRADGTCAVLKVLVTGTGNDPPTRRPSSASSAETDARCSTFMTPTGAPCSWSGWAGLCMSSDCRSPVAWGFSALPPRAFGGRRQTAAADGGGQGPMAG